INIAVSKPNATVAPGILKLDIEALSPRLKNNRYAYETCPSSPTPSGKVVAVTPINKDKRVRFAEPVTSSNNIPKKTDSLKTKYSNKPLLTSTGVKPTTSASGSKPSGNIKNNRITRPPRSNQKNKVEDHSRNIKSSLNKKNSISEPISNALVKHSLRNAKFESMCAICSSKKAKIVESDTANNSESTHLWGSNATDVPSSSSLVNDRSSKSSSGTVRFKNDHVAKIMGYDDYQQGNVIISRVYYVEGLRHNLFYVGQFCDADLEVAFRKNTCFIRNLEGVDLLSGSHDTNLYIISLDDMLKTSPICLLSKASKTKSCKKSSHQPKAEDTNQEKLYILHMDLCGPMRVESINGKKYILVIVDDYSRFTWVKFLRSKDEAPDAIIKCIKNIQVCLNATVRNVRTDNGTEFVNQTLRDLYENVGISHQTSVARTPQQNGVVERRNQTLVEAARTMLIFSKALLFLWAEAINTACYTQNRSLIRLRYNKTPYELMHDKKPNLSFFHVFGSPCYPTNDSEKLGKINEKADIDIFVGYTPTKKAFRIYNRRTRKIIETF
ncbi:retrovirus-related pol polyprotein from transposon TNT 1-94, partial [Tanacetum coccineum]